MSFDITPEKEILLEMLLCTKYGWKQHPEYEYDGYCSICMDDLQGKYVLETACGHCFDYNCILTTINYNMHKCPDCSKEYVKI